MTDADTHAKRANRDAGAKPAAELEKERRAAQPPEKRRVPDDLDRRVFRARVGMTEEDDESDDTLRTAEQAAKAVHKTVDQLHDAEQTILSDPTATDQAKRLKVSQVADKNMTAPAKRVDAARERINADLQAIDDEIAQSFRNTMDRDDAKELREILRGMKRDERRKFLDRERQNGNFKPIVAALSHPEPATAGMSENERAAWRHEYEKTHHPEALARRQKLKAARQQLEASSERFLRHVNSLKDPNARDYAERAGAAEKAANTTVQLDD